jgi:hypothetical protein
MRPPEFERAALLHKVIGHATHELKAPIERIEVVGGRVDCWSKSRQVSLAFSYENGGYYENEGHGSEGPTLGTFHITVGSGSWSVWVVTKPEARKGVIARALAKVLWRRGAYSSATEAIVKDNVITVLLNGTLVKTVRVQIPAGNVMFGIHAEAGTNATNVRAFPVKSFKVTESRKWHSMREQASDQRLDATMTEAVRCVSF